jgi:hypothetical protein
MFYMLLIDLYANHAKAPPRSSPTRCCRTIEVANNPSNQEPITTAGLKAPHEIEPTVTAPTNTVNQMANP